MDNVKGNRVRAADTTKARQTDVVPTTRIRSVRVDDDLWEAAARVAARNRETIADVIRRALLAYVGDELEGDTP